MDKAAQDPIYTPINPQEQLIWDFIQKEGTVTHKSISGHVEVTDYFRTNFISKLKRMGIVKVLGAKDGQKQFTILSADELRKRAKDNVPSEAQIMWTTMRLLRNFDAAQVHLSTKQHAPHITLKRIQDYCKSLMRGGYFRVTVKAIPGKRLAKYKLINDTGPLAPVIRRRSILVDTNLDRVAYVTGEKL